MLLETANNSLKGSQPQQQALEEVINTIELLKLAELQNFFGDQCVQVALNQNANYLTAQNKDNNHSKNNVLIPKKQNLSEPKTAVIYSVIVDNFSQIVLQQPNGVLSSYSVPWGANQMQEEIDRLRSLLEKRSTNEYLVQAKKVYLFVREDPLVP
ncbi:MAG: hypothetical protein ACOC0N_01470 [Chroococcales cyanobacterium]